MQAVIPRLEEIHTIVFDFDGVFTNNKVYLNQDGIESVVCDRGDGLAFDFLRYHNATSQNKIDSFILSKEPNKVVLARADKLKLTCYHGVISKLDFMLDYSKSNAKSSDDFFRGVICFGNDLNDLPLMSKAGFSVAPRDAHPLVLSEADYVCKKDGGNGCIREFMEKFLRIDVLTKEELHELVSNS